MARKSFAGGTIILMLAGFIVKIFGFVYRIYLSNLIGSEGMGIFQLIAPVYTLIVLTLTSGISIAVSKLVAEEFAKGNIVNTKRITKVAFGLVFLTGLIISVFICFYARAISSDILKDGRTYLSLLVLIPCIPIVTAAAALKGYFYGICDVVPTAISQVFEQIVKITFVMILSAGFLDKGLAYACAVATFGMALGEFANLIVVLIIYIVRRNKDNLHGEQLIYRKRELVKKVVKISIPISINRFITSIMSAAEMIMIPTSLVKSGLVYSQAISEFGRLSGMALPLIFFPAFVTSSLATTLVPAISEALSLKRFRTLNHRISKSIQITFVLGFVFTALFVVMHQEISDLLYRRENIGEMLLMLSVSCIFLYLGQTLLGILNGLGKQGVSLRNSVFGYAIRIGFICFAVPVYGLKGYVYGMIVSMMVLCGLNVYAIKKVTDIRIDVINWLVRPGVACAVMIVAGRYVYYFVDMFNFGQKWTSVLAMIGVLLSTGVLMVITGALRKGDVLKVSVKGRKWGI